MGHMGVYLSAKLAAVAGVAAVGGAVVELGVASTRLPELEKEGWEEVLSSGSLRHSLIPFFPSRPQLSFPGLWGGPLS